MASLTIEKLACPFCQSRDIAIQSVAPKDYAEWAAICENCSARGPLTSTEMRAHELWNVRK